MDRRTFASLILTAPLAAAADDPPLGRELTRKSEEFGR
jgi:hypothetical protein